MFSKTFKIIAPALAAAAFAAPIAAANTDGALLWKASQDAGPALVEPQQVSTDGGLLSKASTASSGQASGRDLAGQTEAKGYLAISNYLATRNAQPQAPDLAGRTEAKGYRAISQYLANRPNVTATEVRVVQPGFDWGDAGIGAAMTAGIFLLGGAAALFGLRRRELSLHH